MICLPADGMLLKNVVGRDRQEVRQKSEETRGSKTSSPPRYLLLDQHVLSGEVDNVMILKCPIYTTMETSAATEVRGAHHNTNHDNHSHTHTQGASPHHWHHFRAKQHNCAFNYNALTRDGPHAKVSTSVGWRTELGCTATANSPEAREETGRL